jgi:hypothetical protein
MKSIIYILTSFLLLSFSTNCQKSHGSDIHDFNRFLGKEKAKALNEGITNVKTGCENELKSDKFE